MGFLRKKHDPISERARALNEQIHALESQIQQLSAEAASPGPKFRSTTGPRGSVAAAPPKHEPAPHEHFERIDHTPLQSAAPPAGRDHYNDLGVRKYDLVAGWQRFKNVFKPPPPSNPKLVNYLAAEFQARLVAPHARAQATGEDADFEVHGNAAQRKTPRLIDA